MKVLKPEKNYIFIINFFLGLMLSLFVNRGYIIDSIVGSEYMNIMSSNNFQNFGRLGHRILTPMLAKCLMISLFLILSFLLFDFLYNL